MRGLYLLCVSTYWVHISYEDLELPKGISQRLRGQYDTELENTGAGTTTEVPVMTPCDLGQVMQPS